jgi:hypothetical protein
MSTWHDIVSSQPEDTQLVLARRLPGDCPPFAANWDAANARLSCGPEQWVIPWQFISHWRPLDAAPAWPQPRAAASPWQDIYLCPPADGQSGWLRRSGEECAAFRSVFDRARRVFTLASGWQLHWYQACKWRPG